MNVTLKLIMNDLNHNVALRLAAACNALYAPCYSFTTVHNDCTDENEMYPAQLAFIRHHDHDSELPDQILAFIVAMKSAIEITDAEIDSITFE